MSGDKLSPLSRQLLEANTLWEKFHFINSFVPISGKHNQYLLFKGVKDQFCFEKFVDLLKNNNGVTANGKEAEVDKLEWEIQNDVAFMDYRVNELYDKNLKITKLIGGQNE